MFQDANGTLGGLKVAFQMNKAGEIVAAASGEPYDLYIQRHILDPLGMSSSTILCPTETRNRLAVAYGRRMPDGKRAPQREMDTKGIAPAANLSSTVEDLARYLAFHRRIRNLRAWAGW